MFLLWHPWLTTTNLSYSFPLLETSATALCGTTGILYTYILHPRTSIWTNNMKFSKFGSSLPQGLFFLGSSFRGCTPRTLTWIPKMMVWKGNSLQEWQFLVSMLDFWRCSFDLKKQHFCLKGLVLLPKLIFVAKVTGIRNYWKTICNHLIKNTITQQCLPLEN